MRGHPNLNPNWRDFQEPPERLARATNERTPYLRTVGMYRTATVKVWGSVYANLTKGDHYHAPRRIGHNALSSCRDSRTPSYACFLSLVSALIE